jgi:pimeloyl-ACP methyl ester carboxylesterase
MPSTQRDGVGLSWESHGQAGDPVLLVMGLGGDMHFWEFQIPAFAARHQVVAYDNRGVGQSDKPKGAYTIEMMAEDALAVMDAAGFRRAHVVGISMGGMIAQELAIRHPERVGALVLAATYSKADTEAQRVAEEGAELAGAPSPIAMMRSGSGGGVDLSHVDMKQLYRFMMGLILTPEFIIREREWLRALFQRWKDSGATVENFLSQVAAVLAHDSTARLPSIAAPTLVLTGSDDQLVPPRHSDELHALIPGSRLVVLPGGTHGFNIEMKDAFNDVVLRFLAEHPL